MNEEIDKLYRELLKALKTIDKKYSNYKMDGFTALEGDKYNGELMVIGRAVNGWGDSDGWSLSDIDNGKDLESISNGICRSSVSSGKCPMSWVADDWGLNKKGSTGQKIYNTARSAFWRTIKGVVTNTNLDIAANENNWSSYIAWSNLYKISRHESGNPPTWLCKIQFDYCVRLLIEEIRQLNPKRILFLTGMNWAEPFMNQVYFKKDNPAIPNMRYIEASGFINLEALPVSPRVVVAPHPQGRPERIIIENILKCFN